MILLINGSSGSWAGFMIYDGLRAFWERGEGLLPVVENSAAEDVSNSSQSMYLADNNNTHFNLHNQRLDWFHWLISLDRDTLCIAFSISPHSVKSYLRLVL